MEKEIGRGGSGVAYLAHDRQLHSRPVVLKFPNSTLNFKSGWDYLQSFVLPNIYFHSAMAYAILRHGGVKLGKSDYLGSIGGG